MEWQQLKRMRRRVRHSLRVQEWPWRRKVAIGAWLPVFIVGFVLFTGPNRTSSATDVAAKPATVSTVPVEAGSKTVDELSQAFREIIQTKEAVGYWIQAAPTRLTLKQQVAKARWRSERRKALLGKHRAAVSSSHHPTQVSTQK
jgi:hypothetical protein